MRVRSCSISTSSRGSTCDEYTGEFGSNNADVPGTTSGDLSADDTDSGRWGIPDRFDASDSEPCEDVGF